MVRKHYAEIDVKARSAPAWPEVVPTLTGPEAVRAARRLWRFAMGETFAGEVTLTSGNRFTWTYWPKGAAHIGLRVNADKGWRELVHDLSHLFWTRANPGERPHSKFHAAFEGKLVREVIRRGWLDGKLRDDEPEAVAAPDLDDKRRAKLARLHERAEKWERKQQRAERALAKIAKQIRYYEKALAAPKPQPKPKVPKAKPLGVRQLAELHDLEIDQPGGPGGTWLVYPGAWLDPKDDPHDSDHTCETWGEVGRMVREYVALKQAKAAA